MLRHACSVSRPFAQAIVAVVVATLIRKLLDPWMERGQLFSWYYMAVAVGAWCGGWRCSVLAGVLGYLAADWFFMEPRHQLNVLLGGKGWFTFGSYATVCIGIAVCTEAIRRQAPQLVFRLDLDDSLELLEVAAAVRKHGIGITELPAYLEGLNASQSVYRLTMHLARHDMSPRELAARLEGFVKGAGPVRVFSS